MATQVRDSVVGVTWDDFLISLHACLPADLLSEPKVGHQDPLASAKFLPTQDGRPIAACDTATLFFQPVRGADDAADLVGEVPRALQTHVAFLHEDVRTQEGPQRRNTVVHKFLDGRFARGFRREDVLRHVVVPALPRLPAPYGSPEADDCSEVLAWTLKLLGDDESDALLPLIRRLPVATHGGWRAMSTAVFGSGWPGRLGDLVQTLADQLPAEAAKQLTRTALLPPGDPRWGSVVENRGELFARAGVVDGLRLQTFQPVRFEMSQYSRELPNKRPASIPRRAWDDWRSTVRDEAAPYYMGTFDYELSGVRLLPSIHHLAELSVSGRKALSDLLLASLSRWGAGWESAAITKVSGNHWQTHVTSPLKYWLTTLPWLTDRSDVEPLRRRWLVPESLLRGQRERYAHLDPLSLELARRLNAEPSLQRTLAELGLNVYPTEEEETGRINGVASVVGARFTRSVRAGGSTARLGRFNGRAVCLYGRLLLQPRIDTGLALRALRRAGGAPWVQAVLVSSRRRRRATSTAGRAATSMRVHRRRVRGAADRRRRRGPAADRTDRAAVGGRPRRPPAGRRARAVPAAAACRHAGAPSSTAAPPSTPRCPPRTSPPAPASRPPTAGSERPSAAAAPRTGPPDPAAATRPVTDTRRGIWDTAFPRTAKPPVSLRSSMPVMLPARSAAMCGSALR